MTKAPTVPADDPKRMMAIWASLYHALGDGNAVPVEAHGYLYAVARCLRSMLSNHPPDIARALASALIEPSNEWYRQEVSYHERRIDELQARRAEATAERRPDFDAHIANERKSLALFRDHKKPRRGSRAANPFRKDAWVHFWEVAMDVENTRYTNERDGRSTTAKELYKQAAIRHAQFCRVCKRPPAWRTVGRDWRRFYSHIGGD